MESAQPISAQPFSDKRFAIETVKCQSLRGESQVPYNLAVRDAVGFVKIAACGEKR